MTTIDAAQVLEDAADVLLVNGRCRLTGHSPYTGSFCVLGAIAEAVQPGWHHQCGARYWNIVSTGDGRAAVAALARHLPVDLEADPEVRVYCWSDGTSDDDEVRDTLLLAAKDLRNEAA